MRTSYVQQSVLQPLFFTMATVLQQQLCCSSISNRSKREEGIDIGPTASSASANERKSKLSPTISNDMILGVMSFVPSLASGWCRK